MFQHYFTVSQCNALFSLPYCKVLDFSVFVLQQLEQHPDHLPLTVIVQLDGVLLQLSHQVIRRHESEVLVRGRHLERRLRVIGEELRVIVTFSRR